MKLLLTEKECETFFYNALCNGLSYLEGYGLELKWEAKDYAVAQGLAYAKKGDNACFEDVIMAILRDGKDIHFVDHEGDYNEFVTLKRIHHKVPKVEMATLMEMVNEQDDALTADVILQTVIFGKVIFG